MNLDAIKCNINHHTTQAPTADGTPQTVSQTPFLPEVASVGHSATATRKATKKNKSVIYSRIHTDKHDYVDYRTKFGDWGLPLYRVSAAEDVMF